MISGEQYDALRWCYDMAAQDHRVPETRERLWLTRQALREMIPNRDAPGEVESDYEKGVRDTLDELIRAIQTAEDLAPGNPVDVPRWVALQREQLRKAVTA